MGQTFDPSGLMNQIDDFSADQEQGEDQLRFAQALRFAVPLGLGLWAMAIWGAVRYFF